MGDKRINNNKTTLSEDKDLYILFREKRDTVSHL